MARVLGPIVVHEGRASARRRQTYVLRATCAALLLVGLTVIWVVEAAGKPQGPVRGQPAVGRQYFCVMVGVQLALVLLAAPAFTAGSICDDRIKGVLPHLLVTNLRSAEIVLEKLAASLGSILSLIACAAPVAYVVSWLGGIAPIDLVWAFAIAAAMGTLGCALALALSIWARSAHEALLGVYAVWTLVLLIYPAWIGLYSGGALPAPPPAWARLTNPFWLSFACEIEPDLVSPEIYMGFLAATFGVSLVFIILAVARLRAVTIALAAGVASRLREPTRLSLIGRVLRALPGPSLEGNPVLWREWHRGRLPGRIRKLWRVSVIVYSAVAGICLYGIVHDGVGPGPDLAGAGTAVLLVVGLLMLSASATSSLSEERMRGSLDVLLTTPLSTWSIVWGKWWGAFRGFAVLAAWPAILIAALAFGWRRPYPAPAGGALTTFARPGDAAGTFAVAIMAAYVLAHGAMITSLGLALATWISRQGRAAALCASCFVAVCVGWPLLCFMLLSNTWPEHTAMNAAMLSPFFGFVQLAEYASNAGLASERSLVWLSVWTTVLSLGAAALLAATHLTFNQSLGRVTARDDSPSGWIDRPGAARQSPAAAPLVPPGQVAKVHGNL